MSCGIYKITNIINGKIYIGKSKDTKKRFKEHIKKLKNNTHPNIHLQRTFNLNNKCFIFETIFLCNIQDLNNAEIYFIDRFNSKNQDIGYNFTNGGDGSFGRKMLQSTQDKIQANRDPNWEPWNKGKRGTYSHTIESKRKMSLARKGRTPCLGKKASEETKRKMSLAHKGRIAWNKGIKCPQISLANKGKRHSDESYKKSAASRLGQKRGKYNYNKIAS